MDEADIDKLIELVKQNPAIYDRNSVRYKNSAYKATLWQNIALTLGQAEAEVVTRWKSLRDRFCREHRKMTDPNGVTPRFEWAYYQDLLFLKDHTVHRAKINTFNIQGKFSNKPEQDSFSIKHEQDKSQSPLRMLQVDVVSVKDKELYELEEDTAEYNLNEYINIPDESSESSRNSSHISYPAPSSKKRKVEIEDHNYNHSPNIEVENEIETGILKTLNTFEKCMSMKTSALSTPKSSKEQFFDEVRVFINGFSETEQKKVQNRIIMYLCNCKLEILNDGNLDRVEI